ncbi:MAG TPA: DUF2933 domain-containing protein [Anaerolineae bacterium]|nr:DUF2933 domain-containing protein [Anaerolineae bacterium]
MNHNHSSNGGPTGHMLLMLLCCLIPIGLIAAVAIFGISLGALTPYLPFAIVLLCPLMMFFMMRGMGHDDNATDMRHDETTLLRDPDAPRKVTTNAAIESKPHH